MITKIQFHYQLRGKLRSQQGASPATIFDDLAAEERASSLLRLQTEVA